MSRGTKQRGIRIDDETWDEFQQACKEVGTTASETVRQLIRDWVDAREPRKSG